MEIPMRHRWQHRHKTIFQHKTDKRSTEQPAVFIRENLLTPLLPD
jgi:hypothetical protein